MSSYVVIADMDDEQRGEMAAVIEQSGLLEVAGETGDGEEALEMILRLRPDVPVCSMLMPRLDGMGLLEQLQSMPEDRRPAVMILSNVCKPDLVRRAFELGADDYIIRPCDLHALPGRLAEMCRRRRERCCLGAARDTEQRLSGILLGLGIPAHVKGYRFLQEAIRETMVEPGLMESMIHGLYPRIANKYHTTVDCVERSIRSAIGRAWERCRPEERSRILGRTVNACYENPTSGELIALVAERMRLHM